jgi:uncharacterized protein (TIGR00730 family)
MKSICVYLGANIGNNPLLIEYVTQLGKIIAQNNVRLIYGGSSSGLMGTLANAVLSNNGEVTGIFSTSLIDIEKPLYTLDELIITDTMQERKLLLQQRSDAFLVFPGGLGTLEEAIETWNSITLGILTAPIGFFNVDGYFNKLFDFIFYCQESGFITQKQTKIPVIDSDIKSLFYNFKLQCNNK